MKIKLIKMKAKIEYQQRKTVCDGITKLCIGLFLVSAFFISGIFAQSESGASSLEGNVKDQNGAVVQGATVTVKNTETNLERTVTTDADGNFSVNVLPVGNYTISVNASGFARKRLIPFCGLVRRRRLKFFCLPKGAKILSL